MLVDTAPLVHRVPTAGGLLKRAKYVARGLAFPKCTGEWFQFLQRPELAVVIQNHPYLYHKLQRPYLTCNLSTRERLEALKEHYGFVTEQFSAEGMRSLYSKSGLVLASFPVKDAGQYELRLGCSRKEKEGDLTVGFAKADLSGNLATLSFSIWKYRNGHKEIFIGGLQGNRSVDKEFIVTLTRGLHGLRPKALLVFVMQQLATCWKIPHLRAVSDTTHIYRHFQKRKVVSASYDGFWLECGGILSADGMFDLPSTFVPRDIALIKVNKRQMYRRRYKTLGELADQIRDQLSISRAPAAGEMK
jgi:hypothetical protein